MNQEEFNQLMKDTFLPLIKADLNNENPSEEGINQWNEGLNKVRQRLGLPVLSDDSDE